MLMMSTTLKSPPDYPSGPTPCSPSDAPNSRHRQVFLSAINGHQMTVDRDSVHLRRHETAAGDFWVTLMGTVISPGKSFLVRDLLHQIISGPGNHGRFTVDEADDWIMC